MIESAVAPASLSSANARPAGASLTPVTTAPRPSGVFPLTFVGDNEPSAPSRASRTRSFSPSLANFAPSAPSFSAGPAARPAPPRRKSRIERVEPAVLRGGGGRGGRRDVGRKPVLGVLLDLAPVRHVLEMLVQRLRESVAARSVGDEIDFLGRRRIGDGLERRLAGIADRARRQAADDIGVIGRRLLQFRLADRMSQGALAEDEAVNDRRIGLEFHMTPQTIDEHGGDPWTFVRLARLLLDHRSERDQFAGRLDRQIGRAFRPDFVDRLGLGFGHPRQLGLARVAALKEISVRQQRALARSLVDLSDEHVVVAKTWTT